MWIFLTTLAVLFSASMAGYLIMIWLFRSRTEYVDEAGELVRIGAMPDLPHLPVLLWASTVAILISSATVQWGLSSIRRGHQSNLRLGLMLTMLLGGVFLVLQTLCWFDWLDRAVNVEIDHRAYRFAVTAFIVLSALHAAHVIGGFVPLAFITARAMRGGYSAERHIGVHHVTLYWHFLDAVWLIIFGSLLIFA